MQKTYNDGEIVNILEEVKAGMGCYFFKIWQRMQIYKIIG